MQSILQDFQANRRLADNPNPIGFSKTGYMQLRLMFFENPCIRIHWNNVLEVILCNTLGKNYKPQSKKGI
jgi:hypothetical protein